MLKEGLHNHSTSQLPKLMSPLHAPMFQLITLL